MRVSQVIQFTLFSLFLASQSSFADYQYNLTPGVSPVSHDIYNLHMTIFWICVAIGVVVFGVMFYAIIHHRKSKGVKAAQFHEHLWVELTWTFIPLIILILMAIPATEVLIHINDTEKSEITIKVTGYQWKWRYEYLEHDINFFSNITTPFDQLSGKVPPSADYLRTVDHPLVVPIHKKIRFLMTSNDVIHSWWVPDLGVKRDAVPGFITESWTRINRPGTYYGQCAELCGINHAYMPIVVIAVSEKEFADWVAKQKSEVAAPATAPTVAAPVSSEKSTEAKKPGEVSTKPTTTVTPAAPTTTPAQAPAAATKKMTLEELMKRGEQIYLNTCAVCHRPDGTGMPPVFPSLKDSAVLKGPPPPHLEVVMHGRPGTAMQAFQDQLSVEDIASVITYERNMWGKKGEMVQPEDVKALKK